MPASADERHLRRLLAERVALRGAYYDDGEASGEEHGIVIDFMREPIQDIEAKLRALNVARNTVKKDQAADIERLRALLREAYNFWAHYSCINEPAQDDIADEKDAIIERMRTALAEQK
jgi:hypothetical protein